jgi:hypothetical protein
MDKSRKPLIMEVNTNQLSLKEDLIRLFEDNSDVLLAGETTEMIMHRKKAFELFRQNGFPNCQKKKVSVFYLLIPSIRRYFNVLLVSRSIVSRRYILLLPVALFLANPLSFLKMLLYRKRFSIHGGKWVKKSQLTPPPL